MTFPCSLHLKASREGERLLQKTVTEQRVLREPLYELENKMVLPGDNPLKDISGDCIEIKAEIELQAAVEFGFHVKASETEGTVIGFDSESGSLIIDRSRSGVSGSIHAEFPCRSVEVFANDGEIVMADLIFPDPESKGLELYSNSGNVKIVSFQIYNLRSIW